jgi:CRISPR/Cas system-associated exonuclease Cas4 (RecB family)
MQHKGEIVEKAVRESGYPITKLAKKLGKSRRWMYHLFENRNVPIDYILELGAVIHHDFSDSITDLKKYKASTEKQELRDSDNGFNNTHEKAEYWKTKYLELLEKHNELLTRLNDADPGK